MKLHNMLSPYGDKRKSRRVGRGSSSGKGNYSGRGMRGAKSRSGRPHYAGFEGGQMPLYRRLPKRKFMSFSRKEYRVINLSTLGRFKEGDEITPKLLYEQGLIKKEREPFKILADGKLDIKLTVKAHKFSAKAKEQIEKKGGEAIEIGKEKQEEKKKVKPKKAEKKTEAKKKTKKSEKQKTKSKEAKDKTEKKSESKKKTKSKKS